MPTTHAETAPATGTPSAAHNALGPILVATDGTQASDAALRMAAAMAGHSGADVTVLTVAEPLPMIAGEYGLLLPPGEADESRRKALLEQVRKQVSAIVDKRFTWNVELREGYPAAVIARTALELDARLILCGLGHHEVLDRLFGSETALHSLRLARVPVLAVGPRFEHLPKRAVVATDFSVASVEAARTALSLLDTVSMVYLVHVAPRLELQPEAFAAWMSLYGEGVVPAFERVREELDLPDTVTVETVTRQGKPSRELLEFARSTNADVIITGSRGAGLIDRILVGSTATGLIRGAHCAVLAVPTRGISGTLHEGPEQRISLTEETWEEELKAFTKRNAGRRVALEVDDPELGAQAQEHDYPLLGVDYDRHDRRVEIMLGDFVGTRRHLTRGIPGVSHIDILRDEKGRDWILRLTHGRGQTILTLAR